MKTFYVFVFFITFTWASPKPYYKFQYRNLFKHPPESITNHPRIIGGQEAEAHSIPYQAFLEVHGEDEAWYCGGSLISANYVLTAAHCNEGAKNVKVTLGAHNLNNRVEENHQIYSTSSEHINIHEKFDSVKIINDIGLIKLPGPANFSEYIESVKLPSRADVNKSYKGLLGRIGGWGVTDGFSDKISDVLRIADGKILSNNACRVYFDIVDTNICLSGDDNTGSCNGDSGGPLVVDDVQVGIASFSKVFCIPGYPSGYTRVTRYLDWIETNSDVKIN